VGNRDPLPGNLIVSDGGVLSLTEASEAPLSDVGGKARTLGRLKRAGFKVPDGFVVAPDTSLGGIDLDRHVDGMGPFAVRSSGAAEDGAESSLAGRYRSVLSVEADSILAAVSEVRDSARRVDGQARMCRCRLQRRPDHRGQGHDDRHRHGRFGRPVALRAATR
jgi:hypothetical protein